MKRILIFSVLAACLTMASCTQDGLGTDSEMPTRADDDGGPIHIPVPPPPPPNPCLTCPQ